VSRCDNHLNQNQPPRKQHMQFVFGFIGRTSGRSASWGFGETSTLPWLLEISIDILPSGASATGQLRHRHFTSVSLSEEIRSNTTISRFVPRRLCWPHSWLHDDEDVISAVVNWCKSLVDKKTLQ
jgi:hypothetical protein